MADTIDRACRELFPRRAGYRVRQDHLSGIIRGRRYRISRRGFVGQVSVQLYASGSAYRRCRPRPFQLRVVGHRRVEPAAVPPDFPVAAVALGSIILLIASSLVMLAGRGWWEVARNPSWSWFIDGLGFIGAAVLMVLAGAIAVVMVCEGAALPWSRLRPRLRWPVDPRADERRWVALREQLAHRLPGLDPAGPMSN